MSGERILTASQVTSLRSGYHPLRSSGQKGNGRQARVCVAVPEALVLPDYVLRASQPLGFLGDPNVTALGFSIPESLSRQLWASLTGAQKHEAPRTLRKHPGSKGLLSLHPCGARATTHRARRMLTMES